MRALIEHKLTAYKITYKEYAVKSFHPIHLTFLARHWIVHLYK